MKFHPDVLKAHAQFGGDLQSMQKCYEHSHLIEEVKLLREALRPLAAVVSDIPASWDDDHQCVTACGHFRGAASALEESVLRGTCR